MMIIMSMIGPNKSVLIGPHFSSDWNTDIFLLIGSLEQGVLLLLLAGTLEPTNERISLQLAIIYNNRSITITTTAKTVKCKLLKQNFTVYMNRVEIKVECHLFVLQEQKWVISVKAVHMVFGSGLFIIAIKKVHSEQTWPAECWCHNSWRHWVHITSQDG